MLQTSDEWWIASRDWIAWFVLKNFNQEVISSVRERNKKLKNGSEIVQGDCVPLI